MSDSAVACDSATDPDVPRGTPPGATTNPEAADLELVWLDLKDVSPNPHQPRSQFDPEKLEELADSIRTHGVMQPVVVRPRPRKGGGGETYAPPPYELIAGERRWRAAQIADIPALPAIVRNLDDEASAELALVENLQREDLNPIERAEALQKLHIQFGLTHEQIGEKVGLKRSSVSNLLRLMDLPDLVRQSLARGGMTMGHARALLGLQAGDDKIFNELIHEIEEVKINVRDTELLVRYYNERKPNKYGDYPWSPLSMPGPEHDYGDEELLNTAKLCWPHCQILPDYVSKGMAEIRGQPLQEQPAFAADAQAEVAEQGGPGSKSKSSASAWLADLEKQLAEQLLTKVAIRPGKKAGMGSLTIHYHSLDDFDALLEKLGVKPE